MKKPYIIGIMTVGYLALLFLSFHYISWFIYNNGLHEQDLGAKPVKVYTEEEVVAFLEAEKTAEFLETGEYTQIQVDSLLEKYGDRLPYETKVWVYDGPAGKGYQIIFTDYVEQIYASSTTGQDETVITAYTKAYGYGIDADIHTWDWQ